MLHIRASFPPRTSVFAPGESRDVSGILQKTALDHLGARGEGVLKLGKGRYVLDNPLFVHGGNVVLRGRDRTTLHFTRLLEQSIGRAHDAGGQSVWSWTGDQCPSSLVRDLLNILRSTAPLG
ncbi:hypothetical protein ABZ016_23685 [Streptomyces sp. NPDC006372]|uniref:hypothetical protein n=1 Tax=Streptomyces sp. NPDC006372 TaxID=3155599 RepID=UPI0033BF019F